MASFPAGGTGLGGAGHLIAASAGGDGLDVLPPADLHDAELKASADDLQASFRRLLLKPAGRGQQAGQVPAQRAGDEVSAEQASAGQEQAGQLCGFLKQAGHVVSVGGAAQGRTRAEQVDRRDAQRFGCASESAVRASWVSVISASASPASMRARAPWASPAG